MGARLKKAPIRSGPPWWAKAHFWGWEDEAVEARRDGVWKAEDQDAGGIWEDFWHRLSKQILGWIQNALASVNTCKDWHKTSAIWVTRLHQDPEKTNPCRERDLWGRRVQRGGAGTQVYRSCFRRPWSYRYIWGAVRPPMRSAVRNSPN